MNELGWIVVGAALRVTAIAGVGLLAVLVLKRRGPSAGALVGSSTMLVMVGVSALALSPWPRWWSPTLAIRPQASRVWDSPVTTRPVPPSTQADVPPREPITTAASWSDFVEEFAREIGKVPEKGKASSWRWPAWVAFVFLGGLSFAMSRLGLGMWAVRSLRSSSKPIEDPGLLDVMEILRAELGIEQPVELRLSKDIATPATIGWRRPAILLSEGWKDWDDLERRAVLAHEIAHIYRGDYLTGLLAQVSLSLHFYHPLVHALARRLRLQQELAADALGARLAGGRRPYLTALANLALRQDPRPTAWPARPFLPTRGTFLRRIEMLRDPRILQHSPIRGPARALTVGTLVLAGLLVAGFRGPAGSPAVYAQDTRIAKTPAPVEVQALPPLDPATAASDIHLAVDIRPRSFLENPAFKKLAAQVPAEAPSELKAIISGEIEQILILGSNGKAGARQANAGPPPLAIVIRSGRAYDWKSFMDKPNVKYKEVKGDDFTYFRAGNEPATTCYRILDDQTLLLGAEGDMTNPPIGGDRPKGRHGWDEAWKKLKPGAVRVAFDTPWLVHHVLPPVPPGRAGVFSPTTSIFAPLFDKTSAYAMTLEVAEGLVLDALATSDSEQAAGRVSETVRACLALAKNALPDLRRAAEGGPPQMARTTSDLLDAADAMLETAKVDQEKSVTRLHAKGDTDSLATAVRMLLPAVSASREAARRAQCVNNMKQLALAMHNYASTNACFPPPVLYGPDGKTPYSWRVALLPYLEQGQLYSQYKFDEPWDGPNNSKLIPLMPLTYACPADAEVIASHFSSYYALTGPGTLFPLRKEGVKFQEITDGTSNTIMFVEAKRPIPWTKPEDIPYDLNGPVPQLGGVHPAGFNVSMADGSVRFIKSTTSPNLLRWLFSRNGGEVISADQY